VYHLELIEGTISTPTFSSDVYGFGMSCLELLTGQHPYANRRRDAAVIKDVVVAKIFPERPIACAYLSDRLWTLMTQSWDARSERRPGMTDASHVLENLTLECGVQTQALDDVEMN